MLLLDCGICVCGRLDRKWNEGCCVTEINLDQKMMIKYKYTSVLFYRERAVSLTIHT